MDNVPQVTLTKNPQSSWANKVGQNVSQNKIVTSADFHVNKSGRGTTLKLKSKHKALSEFARYKSEYDTSKAYDINDIVRVMPGKDYTDSSGAVIKVTPGVWICVFGVPSQDWTDKFASMGLDSTVYKRFLRQTDVSYVPIWPEADDVATLDAPQGRYWEMISGLPEEISMCENNVETVHYVDGSPKPEDE